MKLRLLLVTTVAACIEPNLTHCPGDYDCAPELVCDLAHHGCVEQGQLDICKDLGPLAPCSTSTVSGECFDGVCLTPGCGNRVIEVGEQCDDGNHVSGDGCSLDCTSSERCGNGRLDLALGEQCDDGNSISHDGCDSKCETETASFRAIPLAMLAGVHPRTTVFDPVRHRLVVANAQTTWEWDGQAWQIPSLQHPTINGWQALVYDSDRQRVTGLGMDSAGKPVVADWDGTTWTPLAVVGNGPAPPSVVVYDPFQHAILAMTGAVSQYLDVANLKWRGPTSLPFSVSTQAIAAVDATAQSIVLLDPPLSGTWELTGTTWKNMFGRPPADSGWSVAYDASRGRVVEIGGKLAANYDGSVVQWDGQNWTATGASIKPRANAMTWYDPTSMSLGVFGGEDSLGQHKDLVELSGPTAIDHTELLADASGPVFYDSTRHRLLLLGNQNQWSFDGSWHALGPSPVNISVVGYDPIRNGVLGYDMGAGTTSLFQDVWQQLSLGVLTTSGSPSGAYDYTQHTMIEVDFTATKMLASTATSWVPAGPGIMNIGSVAYDRGLAHIVSLGFSTDGMLADLVAGQWEPSLSPGFGYMVASWLARGSVVMVPMNPAGLMARQVWERRDGAFASLGPLPAMVQVRGAAEMAHGQLVIAVTDVDSAFLLTYQYTGSVPDETCVPGEDADGDGLAGCDDPDCWESCWPACPYATSCP